MEDRIILARLRPHHLPIVIASLLGAYKDYNLRVTAKEGLMEKLIKLARKIKNTPLGIVEIIAGQDEICKTPCEFRKDCAAGRFEKIRKQSLRDAQAPQAVYDSIICQLKYGFRPIVFGVQDIEFPVTPAQRDAETLAIYNIKYGDRIQAKDLSKMYLYHIGEIKL